MTIKDEFGQHLDQLKDHLGHANCHRNFIDYCKGLMLPLQRKSVESIAAAMDHENVRSRHQGLHQFVADSAWSDRALLDVAW